MSAARDPGWRWDPALYARFRGERAQPFFDLLARLPDGPVRRAADLGCGGGELTRTLLERWPEAQVTGVDRSPEMLARAAEGPAQPRLRFVQADLADWEPEAPLDRLVSNAALHWLPDHGALLERLARRLAPGGVLAVQLPRHADDAVFAALEALASEAPWRERLRGAERQPGAETPRFYAERLLDLGLEATVWETIYQHHLAGPEAVVEWLAGTALRPWLGVLAPEVQAEFLSELRARVAKQLPAGRHGVFFPFRRLFFVARRTA
jgi:trans-aconitate 2-methyltransferase